MELNREILMRAYNRELTQEVRLYVSQCYFELFNKQIVNPNCENCYQDAAIEILTKMNDKRKYIVHAHIPIQHKGKWYTQPTLTDEIAEEYLKENPEHLNKFKKYPDRKIEKEKPVKEIEPETKTTDLVESKDVEEQKKAV